MGDFPSQFLFILKTNILSVWKIKSQKENVFPLTISYSRAAPSVGQRDGQWVVYVRKCWAVFLVPSHRPITAEGILRPTWARDQVDYSWPKAAYPGPWQPLGSKKHNVVSQTRSRCALSPICFLSATYFYAHQGMTVSVYVSVAFCTGVFHTGDTHIPF